MKKKIYNAPKVATLYVPELMQKFGGSDKGIYDGDAKENNFSESESGKDAEASVHKNVWED